MYLPIGYHFAIRVIHSLQIEKPKCPNDKGVWMLKALVCQEVEGMEH